MDWANERYVRMYIRDTDDLLVLSWEARALLWEIMRKVDRAGVLETRRGARGIAAITRLPADVVERVLPELMDGAGSPLIEHPRGYLMRNFIEAQETPSTDRLRAQESRGRRRDLAMGVTVTNRDSAVTNRDATITFRDEASRGVTRRHAASHGVTLIPSDPTLRQPDPTPRRPAGPGGQAEPDQPQLAKPDSTKPDPADLIAQTAVAEIERHTGRRFGADSDATLKLARALAKKRHTPDEVRRVVEHKATQWAGDPKMAEFLRPSTLLALTNFENYLDEITAGPVRVGPRPQPSLALVEPRRSKPL